VLDLLSRVSLVLRIVVSRVPAIFAASSTCVGAIVVIVIVIIVVVIVTAVAIGIRSVVFAIICCDG
jgi:hypothetical protein